MLNEIDSVNINDIEINNVDKKSRNKHLNIIQRKPNNEFYTLYEDIEKELQHYKKQLKDKIIYLPCDDYKNSQFFMYFVNNFHDLGIKKLIASCFANNDKDLFLSQDYMYKQGYYVIYDGYSYDGKKLVKLKDVKDFITNHIKVRYFKADGDFRSAECKELLKQSDIVITNPPFSLFREFVLQMVKFEKKFLVIGNNLSLNYVKIFKLYKEKKIWIGYNEVRNFKTQDNKIAIVNCKWLTNLKVTKEIPKPIDTGCYYYKTPWKYPKYDFYGAINVEKVSEIPMDYAGVIGVPIGFLYSYNPSQFEILGISKEIPRTSKIFLLNGNLVFARVLIRHKKYSKTPIIDRFSYIKSLISPVNLNAHNKAPINKPVNKTLKNNQLPPCLPPVYLTLFENSI